MHEHFLSELSAAIRDSGIDPTTLMGESGVSSDEFALVLRHDPSTPAGVVGKIVRSLGLRVSLAAGIPRYLESDAAREAEAERLLALADSFAYEGAKRVESRELIAACSILQAIYTTTDSLFNVDYWYRMKLGAARDHQEAQVYFESSGRRMSCVQDGLKFRKEPLSKKAAMTAREWVFEAERTRFVVLLCRSKDAAITQIVITLFPMEGEPGRPTPVQPTIVEPLPE